MRRSVLIVAAMSALIAAGLAVVTNYATAQVPAFFTEDPWRVWFVFGLLVLLGLVTLLLGLRLPTSPPSEQAAPPASRDSRRRAQFAEILLDDMRRLAIGEEWRDSRFTELEAEVEVGLEVQSRVAWLRRRLGGASLVRVQRVASLTDALRASDERLVVLEGEPGAGKSIALRHLTHRMAEQAHRRPSEQSVLAIYVNLKNFRPADGARVAAADVERFVLDSLNPSRSRDIDRYLQDRFDADRSAGRWLFLFDSFDEIPAILGATEAGPVIDDYVEAIAGFIGLGRSRAVIASREFRGPSRAGRPRFRAMPSSRERRELFIRRADLDRATEQTLIDGLDGMELHVQQLTDNPLFLSLLCEYVRDRSELPQSTHEVIESYVRSRLHRDQDRIESRFAVSVDDTRAVAEEMAFVMLSASDLGLAANRAEIIARLVARLERPADEVASALDALLYCKLTRSAEDDARVTFAHRRIQEYFATCAVLRNRDYVTLSDLLTDGRWRETVVVLLQTQRAGDSVEMLTAIEQRLRTVSATASEYSLWPTGSLYLLDLMANALTPADIARHPVSDVAAELLDRAWAEGDHADRKWVIELCAASGDRRAINYLVKAFDSGSMWLRDEAYRQVRRVGPAASGLEPQIRQMLIDMSVGGNLRRERRSVRVQMQRLPFTSKLPRVVDLLLGAPVTAALACPLAVLAFAPLTPEDVRNAVWLLGAIATPAFLAAVLFNRLSMASSGCHERYFRSRMNWLGLSPENIVSICSIAVLWVALPAVCGLAGTIIAALAKGNFDIGSMSGALEISLGLAAAWIWTWPFSALWAVREGAQVDRRNRPAFPFTFILSVLRAVAARVRRAVNWRPSMEFLRRLRLDHLVPLALFAVILLFGIALIVGLVAFFVYLPVAKYFVAAGAMGVIFAAIWVRKLRDRSRDRQMIAALIADGGVRVYELRNALDKLQTEDGVHLLLADIRREGWHRDPEAAAFLSFLSVVLQRGSSRDGSSSAEAGEPAASRPDWNAWWASHLNGYGPLRFPSSEAVDELGRILEEARRSGAFREPA